MRKRNDFLWIILSLLISATTINSFGQTKEFDSIFNRVSTVHTFTEPTKALHMADSLYRNSTEPIYKIRALMLQANIFFHQKDLRNARKLAKEAEKIAVKSKNIDWQIRIRGFYSNIYGELSFIKEGLKEFDEIDRLLTRVSPSPARDRLYLLNQQGKAYFYSFENQVDSVLYFLKKGEKVYQSIGELKDGGYHIAISEELKARTYFMKNDFENSYAAYQIALTALEPYQNTAYPVYGYIYAGLGSIMHLKNRDSVCAKKYFDKAKAMTRGVKNPEMYYFITERLREFYADHNDYSSFRHLTEIRDSLRNTMNYERKIMIANFYGEAKTAAVKSQGKIQVFYMLIGVLGLILLVLLSRLSKVKYQKYIEKEGTQLLFLPEASNVDPKKEIVNTPELNIAKETRTAILEKLQVFEDEKMYLDTNVNMALVATFCKTNSRYISEIIKKYKDADFHSYINRLRIEYIVKKLQEDERYRIYKISYLAEEACFSSHSKFSAMFKEVKGVSPSVFIKQIRKKTTKSC